MRAHVSRNIIDSLDPEYDLHVTYDFGSTMKINTGLLVIKTSAWSANFLDQVCVCVRERERERAHGHARAQMRSQRLW